MGKGPCGCLDLRNRREIESPWRWGAQVTVKVLKKEELMEEGPSSAPTLNVRVLVCDDATRTFVGSGVLISQGVGHEQIKNTLNVPILYKLTFSGVSIHWVALNFGQFTRVPPRLALKLSAGYLRSPLEGGSLVLPRPPTCGCHPSLNIASTSASPTALIQQTCSKRVA